MEYTLKSLFNIDNRVDVRDGYLDQEKRAYCCNPL